MSKYIKASFPSNKCVFLKPNKSKVNEKISNEHSD